MKPDYNSLILLPESSPEAAQVCETWRQMVEPMHHAQTIGKILSPLFSDMTDGVCFMTLNGTIAIVSRSFLRQLDYDEDFFRLYHGCRLHDIVETGSIGALNALGADLRDHLARDSNAPFKRQVTLRLVGSRGRRAMWLRMTMTYLLPWEEGIPPALMAIFEDISRQRDLESSLRKADQRYRGILESMADGYFELDPWCRFTFVNPAFYKMLEREQGSLLGYNISHFLPGFSIQGANDNVRQYDDFSEQELVLRTPTGRQLHLTVSLNAVHDNNLNLAGFRGVLRDHTELKRIRDKIRRYQKTEDLGSLSGTIAHDFNNILTAIGGHTELAQKQTDADGLTKHLEAVLSACQKARVLIRRLLSLNPESGEAADQGLRPLHFSQMIHDTLNLVRVTLDPAIDIQTDFDDRVVVMADPTKIHQMLMNLISNAGQAMREKGGRLTLRLAPWFCEDGDDAPLDGLDEEMYQNNWAVLSVTDTGCGMGAETLECIFEPFFTTKGAMDGSGLGLVAIQKVLAEHEGRMHIQSAAGEGSTFTIFLPLSGETPKDERRAESGALSSSVPAHILVADDEAAVREITCEILSYYGYEVTLAQNAVEALDIFDREGGRFDLLITDNNMPGMSGLELSRGIFSRQPKMPIILCSGDDLPAAEELVARNICHLLKKPVSVTSLAGKVKELLDDARKGTSRIG